MGEPWHDGVKTERRPIMSKENKDHQEMAPAEKNRFWQAHIETWKQSGISQTAYCRSKGLSWRSFGYWKKKFYSRKPPLTFVPVTIKRFPPPAGPPGTSLKLLTRSGYGIEIGDGFNPDTLKKLLNTLAGGV